MKLCQIIPHRQIERCMCVCITLLSSLRANFIFLRQSVATATILFVFLLLLFKFSVSTSNRHFSCWIVENNAYLIFVAIARHLEAKSKIEQNDTRNIWQRNKKKCQKINVQQVTRVSKMSPTLTVSKFEKNIKKTFL